MVKNSTHSTRSNVSKHNIVEEKSSKKKRSLITSISQKIQNRVTKSIVKNMIENNSTSIPGHRNLLKAYPENTNVEEYNSKSSRCKSEINVRQQERENFLKKERKEKPISLPPRISSNPEYKNKNNNNSSTNTNTNTNTNKKSNTNIEEYGHKNQ